MSDINNSGWPFGTEVTGEAEDFSAIFGGGDAAGDVNPFEALAEQALEPSEPPAQSPASEPAAKDAEAQKVAETETVGAPNQDKAAEPAAQSAETDHVEKGEAAAPAAAVPETAEQPVQTVPPVDSESLAPPAAEATNPIEAAFAKHEEKAAQAKVKSLFEKAPVFSYGSVKEDITDPAQTFEELRIAKSDDFPELSEGKRVSWSVEYGKVTKTITDPKGTTIRSVKEEIERSTAFLNGLKKAKDKNPDCLVKPRVTAQSKGIAAYKGLFLCKEDADASEKSICIVPGSDGRVYEMRKTELGEFIAPKDNVIEFSQIRAGFTPALPLIPQELLQQIISFFRCYMGEVQEFEALAHILWDKETQEFVVHIPQQHVSKMRVDANLTRDSLPEDRYLHYADIHSHNSMEAKFSPVDDQDERATRIYIVVGRLDRFFPDISVRMSCGGTFQELDPATVIESLGAIFPREWRDNVSTSAVSAKAPLPVRYRVREPFWGDKL